METEKYRGAVFSAALKAFAFVGVIALIGFYTGGLHFSEAEPLEVKKPVSASIYEAPGEAARLELTGKRAESFCQGTITARKELPGELEKNVVKMRIDSCTRIGGRSP